MKGFYFLLLLLFFSGTIWSQSVQERTCAAQIVHAQKLENNPVYKSSYEKIQIKTKEFQEQLRFSRAAISNTVRDIPVYVHIIYNENSPEQNISIAQIESQIQVLNEDFRALNTDISGVPTEFEGVVSDYQLTFTLEGITRKSSSKIEWETNDEMKSTATGGVDPITPETHLNIWVCKLSGTLLGYAQFPGGAFETDGVVVGPEFFGSSDYDTGNNFYLNAPFNKGRTTTHEIGHYLNLRHIWGDGNCTVDDGVLDTPVAAESNGGCPAYPTKSCTENTEYTSDMFMNYMDYTNDACMFMFSAGQKTRSYALFEPGGFRENLGQINDGCDLAAPIGLALVDRTTTSLSLTWDAVTNASSYDVWANGIINSSATNSIQLTGLEEGNTYEIKVKANCVDGGSGEYSSVLSINTLGCYSGPLLLSITTDNFGAETSWALTYEGNVVQTDSITYENNTTYTETFDFGNGNYQFEIFDTANDGICCNYGNGSYSLIDNDDRIIKSGGVFGSSDSVSFCVETIETIDCSTAITANLGNNIVDTAPKLFEFDATEDREYIISSVGSTTIDTDLSIFSDCNTLLASNDNFENLQSEVTLTLSAGQKIYINWRDTHSTAGFDWSITKGRSSQTISFTDLPEKFVNDEAFELSATASSGLAISYSSSNLDVATISGSTLTIIGAGQTTITASQDGNADYLAAPTVQKVLTVNKLDQTISITSIADKFITDPDFDVEATASSGLALTYEISGPATINGTTISLEGTVGTVTITANQAGNEQYNAATASESFQVTEDPCIGFSITEVLTSDVSCAGESDGLIEVIITGGIPPFTYSLNESSQVESNIWEGLSAGEYIITVTDSIGCTLSDTVLIGSPNVLEISAEVTNSTSLDGNGAIELTVSGGMGAYSYLWSNGANTSMIDGLEIGVYTVIVTDENGCSKEQSFELGGVTSNDNAQENEFKVYPNPAHSEISLIHNGKSDRLKIYNARGKIIKDLKVEGESTKIDLSNWSPGLYFIRLNKVGLTQKFVKY
ncbi:T9SS type A sorting domain-containing protein [Marivirga sp.]|uniref:T9SS type A sorting domain-containing protein n=1 Tax=Marivirga sp. TaxID=2018662 RepID=UPI0025EF41A1|nr:T9SS type A sorting domain-containing protein [Marivirga sp.]